MKIVFFIYFSISFIFLGWMLDIIEEKTKKNEEKNTGHSKARAILLAIFWLPALIVQSLINKREEKIIGGKEAYEADCHPPQARLI